MDLSRLSHEVLELTTGVSAYLRSEFTRVHHTRVELKSLNQLVSHVDREAERRLVEGLLAMLPGSDLLAEEGTAGGVPGADWRWVIDPLDGTTNFLHGLPCFAVSIGLENAGQAVFGVVEAVMQRETFHSYRGAPLYLNGAPQSRLAPVSLRESVLATGFPFHDFSQAEAYLRLTDELMRNTRGLRRWGAAAVDLAYVACGRFQGFYEYALQPWDLAAGAFLIQQAGGEVSDFAGGNSYRDGSTLVAGAPELHAELLERVRSAGLRPG